MRNSKKTVKFYFKTFEDENYPSILCRVGSQGKKPDPETSIRCVLQPGDTYSSIGASLAEDALAFEIKLSLPISLKGQMPQWQPIKAKELNNRLNQINYILDWCRENKVRANWVEDLEAGMEEMYIVIYIEFKDLYPHIIPEKTFEARPKRHGDKNPRERGRLRKNKL